MSAIEGSTVPDPALFPSASHATLCSFAVTATRRSCVHVGSVNSCGTAEVGGATVWWGEFENRCGTRVGPQKWVGLITAWEWGCVIQIIERTHLRNTQNGERCSRKLAASCCLVGVLGLTGHDTRPRYEPQHDCNLTVDITNTALFLSTHRQCLSGVGWYAGCKPWLCGTGRCRNT